jgi:hypothetical protein
MVNYKTKYLEMKLKYINAKNNLAYGGMETSSGIKYIEKANNEEIDLLDIKTIKINGINFLDTNYQHNGAIKGFNRERDDITANHNIVIEIYNKKYNNRMLIPMSSKYNYYYIKFEYNKLLVLDKYLQNVNHERFIDDYIDEINESESKWDKGINNEEVKLIEFKNSKECFKFNRVFIDNLLIELNIKLKQKCRNLSLKLDYYYNLPNVFDNTFNEKYIEDSLVLCLYDESICISSIILKIFDDNNIVIDSQTNKQYQGRNYNKLLRSVAILLLNHMYCNGIKIKYILSVVVNPISGYLLSKDYDVDFIDGNNNKIEISKKISNFKEYEEIVEEIEYIWAQEIRLDIEKNEKLASNVFINAIKEVSKLIC